MNIFHFKKIIFLFVLSIGVLSLSVFNQKFRQDFLRKRTYFLIAESQALLSSVQDSISDQIKKYIFLLNLRKENNLLKQENQELHIQQQILQDTLKENERLRQIVDFPKKIDMKVLAAQVISYDFLSRKDILIVNKGSKDGVKKFMGVLHIEGVLGFVFRVSPHTSQVITLEHPLASLAVRNKRNRKLGLLFSSLGETKLHFWSEDLEIKKLSESFKERDILVTTQSNQFPPGLLVGAVESLYVSRRQIKKQNQAEIFIKPFVNFESLEELFILLEPFEPPFSYRKRFQE